MVKQTSDQSFKKDVLEAQGPVLVDFWAPWCGPCRVLGPVLEKIGAKTEGKAEVFKLNVDENPHVASTYGITAIPTVMLFKQGKMQQQMVGVMPEQAYLEAVQRIG